MAAHIRASPNPEIVIASRRFRAAYRILGGDEAIAVLAGYERRHRIAAPIIRRVLSRLVGWHYSGSPKDRRRVAAQLPFIAFRPVATPDRGR